MEKIEIDYKRIGEGDVLFLLTRPQKDRIRARIAYHRKMAESLSPPLSGDSETGEGAGESLEGLQHHLEAMLLEGEMENDRLIRETHANELLTMEFQAKSPEIADQTAITRALRRDREEAGVVKPTPEEESGRRVELAYEQLKPSLVKGWEGEIPITAQLILAMTCYALIYPSVAEDQALFLASSPLTSNSAKPSAAKSRSRTKGSPSG